MKNTVFLLIYILSVIVLGGCESDSGATSNTSDEDHETSPSVNGDDDLEQLGELDSNDIDSVNCPELTISTDKVDFGFVVLGNSACKDITVSNQGSTTHSITNINISSGDISEFALLDGPCGEGQEIVGSMSDMKQLPEKQSFTFGVRYVPADPGKDKVKLAITTNESCENYHEIILESRCKGDCNLIAEPAIADFGTLASDFEPEPIKVSIKNDCPDSDDNITFEIAAREQDGNSRFSFYECTDSAGESIDFVGTYLAAGKYINCNIGFTGSLHSGDYSATYTIRTKGDECIGASSIVVSAHAVVEAPEIAFMPANQVLGFCYSAVGTAPPLTKSIKLKNIGSVPVTLLSSSIDPPESPFYFPSGAPAETILEPNQELTMAVVFEPQYESAFADNVLFQMDFRTAPFAVTLLGKSVETCPDGFREEGCDCIPELCYPEGRLICDTSDPESRARLSCNGTTGVYNVPADSCPLGQVCVDGPEPFGSAVCRSCDFEGQIECFGNQPRICRNFEFVDLPACNDAITCTQDICDPTSTSGCSYLPRNELCNDTNDCTIDTCDPDSTTIDRCIHEQRENGSSCNDDLFCTVDTTCNDGRCLGITRDCNTDPEYSGCYSRVCNEVYRQCNETDIALPDGTPCDDGEPNTEETLCQSGICQEWIECEPNDGICCINGQISNIGQACTGDGNDCTVDNCNDIGVCTHVAGNEGEVCEDDGNACNGVSTCVSGSCDQTTEPVTCTALDECHVAGTCNTETGICDNPVGNEGEVCEDDNDACNGISTCVSGSCTQTTESVTCMALDECHVAGECNPADGTCSNPVGNEGEVCEDDNDACNGISTCVSGSCTQTTESVTCTALDECHVAGECNPADGTCSNPVGNEGEVCEDDGNACNGVSTCVSGSCDQTTEPVTCTALDECHVAGTCNTETGICDNPVGNEGEVCEDDGNACNGVSTCVSGSCDQTTEPVTCTALDECHVAGTCNTETGICDNPVGNEGEVCEDDGNACNGISTCVSGSCTQTTESVTCTALDECHVAGECNPADGTCSNPVGNEGEVCEDDGNACNGVSTCVSGSCDQTTEPVTCTALDECHVAGECNPADGTCSNPVGNEGEVCEDDNDACNGISTCVSGSCTQTTESVTCTALDECHVAGECNPADGTCSNPVGNEGEVCEDDNDACNGISTCVSGSCTQTTESVTCTALDECHVAGECNPADGTCSNPVGNEGEVCEDDGNACNGVSTCVSGSCDQTTEPVTCTALDECHVAGTCNTETGICDNPVGNEGEVCEDDNDACNGISTCVSGSCTQTTESVTCTALDECHVAGECNPADGTCSNPVGNEGEVCEDDGNACNGVSTCVSGSCDQTTEPVTCTALDECHVAGECNPADGTCSNPVGNEGEVCEDDNDACNGISTCVSGSCTQTTESVTCTALDECHVAGECNPADGTCSNPVGNEGEVCEDDNDACNGISTCVSGSCTQTTESVTCTALDECHVAGECNPADGTCSNPVGNEGEVCEDDGNACNGVSTCVSGSCDQTTEPVTCTALDECHVAGECNPADGTCSNPVGNEGEVCEDDGNACNGVSTCVSGSCDQTTEPVTCTALDECHVAGTCNTETGICDNPVGNEGEVCEDDGNACNGVSTCVSGSCDQTTEPVTCTALDECHVAGTCNTETGICDNPVGNEGEVCEDDNDACNGISTCVSGSCTQTTESVTCTALDECHVAGECNPADGTCSNPVGNEGEVCEDDGNACNGVSTCVSGSCDQTTEPVTCTALDECHVAGECNPADGTCSNPVGNEGEVCEDDGNACNGVSTCVSGSCDQTTEPVTCTALDECHVAGTCNTETGICDNPVGNEGEVCEDDGNACNGVSTCVSGSCDQTTEPVTCTALDECHVAGTCNTETGICDNPVGNEGEVCEDDNDACNGISTCVSGSCTQTTESVTCTALDECHVAGECNPADGTCSNPVGNEGEVCEDDNDACNGISTCVSGSCTQTTESVTCTALDQCHVVGTCNPTNGECSNPNEENGTECDDQNSNTGPDQCQDGVCLGEGCVCYTIDTCCDGCQARLQSSACDDDDPCTYNTICDIYGACVGNTVVCSDDECLKRECNNTALCSETPINEGEVCEDNGDACDGINTCVSGNCNQTTESVTCTALDECHVAGECNPADGTCSNPVGHEGEVCEDDNDACNGISTCVSGSCTQTTESVTCTALDECHVAGECNPADGTCSNPVGNEGEVCEDDGNACNGVSTCVSGSCDQTTEPVTCTALDECHVAGTCNTETGICDNPVGNEGEVCEDDNDACNGISTCVSGSCTQTTESVTCMALDECHVAGECNPADGTCSNPVGNEGEVCEDDNDACNGISTCVSGSCTQTTESVTCTALDECHVAGECNPADGTCSNPVGNEGEVCEDDGNACNGVSTCVSGSCDQTTEPVTCTALDECHVAGTCNTETGICDNPVGNEGEVCEDDNDACNGISTCVSGSCTQTTESVTCTALDECHVAGECNPADGTCSNPVGNEGEVCEDDNDACNGISTCVSGSCTQTTESVTCTALDQCHVVGTCNPTNGECSNPNEENGTECDDQNSNTGPDQCQDGVCLGEGCVCYTIDTCCDGCQARLQSSACDDDDPCTYNTICDIYGACVGNTVVCSDDECLKRECNNTALCSETPINEGEVCEDNGDACDGINTCVSGNCNQTTESVTCTALDECHVAGECNPADGTCSNPVGHEGEVCEDDNDACNGISTCVSGSCTQTTESVTCTALDECHVAGECNPADGTCSNPVGNEGEVCEDDGNACNGVSTCVSGSCDQTTEPVTCTALDECHVAGTCNTETGICDNPVGHEGEVCEDDNDACNGISTCVSGSCTQTTESVTCMALDECHVAGECNPADGTCSNPVGNEGEVCEDDNDACNGISTCVSGSCTQTTESVTCTALDECHVAGECNPADGTCSNPVGNEGEVCEDDGNACNGVSTCVSGSCDQTTEPVTCTALDECHVAGTCNTETGICDNPVGNEGEVCEDDGNACNGVSTCVSGSCDQTTEPVTCTALDECHVAGTCNTETGICDNPVGNEGEVCEDDNDACNGISTCVSGSCTQTTESVTCMALDECHVAGECNPADGTCSNPVGNEGEVCEDDNDACNGISTCVSGSCTQTTESVTCTALDECHVAGECNPADGTCSNPVGNEGEVCEDDNDACNGISTCVSGSCTQTTESVTCTALDQCHVVGTCNPTNGECSNPNEENGTECDDQNSNTGPDQCQDGVCLGEGCVCYTIDTCCDGCQARLQSSACDDDDPCTYNTICDIYGACVGNTVVCSDDECLKRECNNTALCSETPINEGEVCEDNGDACDGINTCVSGNCNQTTESVTCMALDECHVAGECNPADGTCSNPVGNEGEVCEDDNDACNGISTCVSGSCTQTTESVTCTALDECHVAGECNPADGTCSNPVGNEGEVCEDDGNACNGVSTCVSGSCDQTTEPVTCTALDECHVAGTCNTETGICDNPVGNEGEVCEDDNDACNGISTCVSGSCTQTTESVTCMALDECHVAGECNPADGTCSNPVGNEGEVCEDDGNACNGVSTCVSGSCDQTTEPVTCTALDECHVAGECNPADGTCSNPVGNEGEVCEDDNDACNGISTCVSGSCTQTTESVTCTALDECHVAGECNPADGTCSNPVGNEGEVCEDDGNACNGVSTCVSGSCDQTTEPVTCTALDECHVAGTCNTETGICDNPVGNEGEVCEDDGNACNGVSTCVSGSCDQTTEPVTCTALDECHVAGTCNTETGICDNPVGNEGEVCEDDNDACNGISTCVSGSCTQTTESVTCTALDECHVAGECNPADGTCSNPVGNEGEVCEDDNDACNGISTCVSGSCTQTTESVTCTALDQCHVVGTCNPTNGECSNPNEENGTECDDQNSNTGPDQCQDGVCLGEGCVCYTIDTCCDGCQARLQSSACDDDDPCTYNTICDIYGACVGNTVVCSDDECLKRECNNTALCSETPINEGEVCEDNGDACDGINTCVSGNCNQTTESVTCTALDECHVAGECNPADGTCSNPVGHEGEVCEDDNDACNGISTCVSGSCTQTTESVTCTALDECHVAGECNPADGTCSNPVGNEGEVCEDDGNACNGVSTCVSGSCDQTTEPVTCTALDECHVAGTCNTETGICDNPVGNEGEVCEDDNDACNGISTCVSGSCTQTTESVTCMALDECHVAGECNPADGTCSNPVGNEGEVCEDDGNACNGVSTCVSGSCDQTTEPVTCTALDECHVAGECNPADGTCSNPVGNEGEVCEDDNDACNGISTCVSGSCTQTTESVTCTALDECHVAGECNPADGTCSNPVGNEGEVCEDDGNACNGVSTCVSGSCDQTTEPVTCTALDECHVAGTCNTETGICDNPVGNEGEVCEDDGNACNGVSTCVSGSCDQTTEPVTCTALDECHVAGTCNTETGICDNPVGNEGEVCEDDNDACNGISTCVSGSCTQTTESVTCTALDECHVAGECNPADGTCSNPVGNEGEVCEDDGNACNGVSTCVSGSCDQTTEPVTCTALDECHVAGTCNTETGICDNPVGNEGEVCEDDNDACNGISTCVSGSCTQTTESVTCMALDECHVAGECNPADGTCSNPVGNEGEVCEDDGNACNGVSTCISGSCNQTTESVTCTALDECHVAGECNPADGTCSNPTQTNGTSCGEDNQCYQGVCVDCVDEYGCADLEDDGLECSEPSCNTETHVCEHWLAAHDEELCGDTTSSICDDQDTCDEQGICRPNHKSTDTPCRSSNGLCDIVELCAEDGTCPEDSFENDDFVCRNSEGQCDLEELCTGASPTCPDDAKSTTVCRNTTNECDLAEYCDGESNDCPADEVKADGTACAVSDQCVAGFCEDCYDGIGCEDLTWGLRDDDCSERICGEGNICEFNDGTDGTVCGTDDQCVSGACRDCYTVEGGCGDLTWDYRDDECATAVCESNLCSFTYEDTGVSCDMLTTGDQDQCDGQGVCVDCVDLNGCNDLADDDNDCTDLVCISNVCNHENDDTNTCSLNTICTSDVCEAGACVAESVTVGCFIDGICIDENDLKASTGDESCLICDSANPNVWTVMEGGEGCNDGNEDTSGDSCSADGVCQGSICPHSEVVENCTDGWCAIPAGCFWMGSPDGTCPDGYSGECSEELGRYTDEILHKVTLTHDYSIMQNEVTQLEFETLMGTNPSRFPYCGENCPVERVNWYDALAYANALSRHKGFPECYVLSNCTGTPGSGCDGELTACRDNYVCDVTLNGFESIYECPGYRLPSEAEWEYAARAGTNTGFYNGSITEANGGCGSQPADPNLIEIGWYTNNSINAGYGGCVTTCSDSGSCAGTREIGSKISNNWGLYDTSGNVLEWVWDWYGTLSENGQVDPEGPETGTNKIVRGGGWYSSSDACRNAARGYSNDPPSWKAHWTGFRLVKSCICGQNQQCGDDGCGGTCGSGCQEDWQCVSSMCTPMLCVAPFPPTPEQYSLSGDVVHDTFTGLTWQQSYVEGKTWEEAGQYCSNLDLEGLTDWRLPEPQELFTLFKEGICAPAIETTVFDSSSEQFWTAREYVADTQDAWEVWFNGCNYDTSIPAIIAHREKINTLAVRCVHGSNYYDEWSTSERFVESEDVSYQPMVYDRMTNLQWKRDHGTDTYPNASNNCLNLNYGGYVDWRLPNTKELLSLIDYFQVSPATHYPVSGTNWTLSSVTVPSGPYSGWPYHISTGNGSFSHQASGVIEYYYCVRGETCECIPDCYNKICGGDGCGGSCGTCSNGETCNSSGQCIAPCIHPEVVENCNEGWCTIPSGCFWMGSPDETCPDGYPGECETELGRIDHETLHEVHLTQGFSMMDNEVTQSEWRTVAQIKGWSSEPGYYGLNGEGTYCGDDCPVEMVNWYEALQYANALSEKYGLASCYVLENCTGTIGEGCEEADDSCNESIYSCASVSLNNISKPQDCEGYRLPTESEWEYAARSGSNTAFYNGDITVTDCTLDNNLNEIAWYCGNADSLPHPIKEKISNSWGLFDMSGNVYNWVWDTYGTYPETAIDPTGGDGDTPKITRGGSFDEEAWISRCAHRGPLSPDTHRGDTGFRLVKSCKCGENQKCGDDGCGNSCGVCESGFTCNLYNQCAVGGLNWLYSQPADVEFTKSEITVDQYQACVLAGSCSADAIDEYTDRCNSQYADRGDHPINCIPGTAMKSFCEWAGGRLPTEEEWYAEASNNGAWDYAWGDDSPTCNLCIFAEDYNILSSQGCWTSHTWPVCSKEQGNSISGLCDMIANINERALATSDGTATARRGSAFHERNHSLLMANYVTYMPSEDQVSDVDGFRCVREDVVVDGDLDLTDIDTSDGDFEDGPTEMDEFVESFEDESSEEDSMSNEGLEDEIEDIDAEISDDDFNPSVECLIDSRYYLEGDLNPNNPCGVCDPELDSYEWSPNGWCWFDVETGLIWQNPPGSGNNWNDANSYCEALTLGNIESWSLPTIDELRTIIQGCPTTETGGICTVSSDCLVGSCYDGDCYGCTVSEGPDVDDGGVYRYLGLSGAANNTWSSSTRSDSTLNAWTVNFENASTPDRGKSESWTTRCVTECTPSCEDKECGPDGCGGWCEPNDCGEGECNWETGLCEMLVYNGCSTTDCGEGSCTEISGVGICECPQGKNFNGETCIILPVESSDVPNLDPTSAEPGHFVTVSLPSIQAGEAILIWLGDAALSPVAVFEGSAKFLVPPLDPITMSIRVQRIEAGTLSDSASFSITTSTETAPTPEQIADVFESRMIELNTTVDDAISDLNSDYGLMTEEEEEFLLLHLSKSHELILSALDELRTLQDDAQYEPVWKSLKHSGVLDIMANLQFIGERPGSGMRSAQGYSSGEYWFTGTMRRIDTANMLLTNICSALSVIEFGSYVVSVITLNPFGIIAGRKLHKVIAALERIKMVMDVLPSDIKSIEMTRDRQFISTLSVVEGDQIEVDFRGDFESEKSWEEAGLDLGSSGFSRALKNKYFMNAGQSITNNAIKLATWEIIDWLTSQGADLVANMCEGVPRCKQNTYWVESDRPLYINPYDGPVRNRISADLLIPISILNGLLEASDWMVGQPPGRTAVDLQFGVYVGYDKQEEEFIGLLPNTETLSLNVYRFRNKTWHGLVDYSWVEHWDRKGLSVTCSPECICPSGVCCDNCEYKPSSEICQINAQYEYGCPWGTACGDDVGIHYRDRYCSGTSEACDGSYSPWKSWLTEDNCSSTEFCTPGDPTCNGGCVTCECSGGDCCSDGCNFDSSSRVCNYSYDEEYQCAGSSCGDDGQRRYKYRYCSGGSSSCSGSTVWQGWQTIKYCDSDELCSAGSSSVSCNYSSTCVTPEEVCNGVDDDGDGTIDELESCWVPVYRFWKTSMSMSARARCWGNSTTTPSGCVGHTLEFDGPVFFLYKNYHPNTIGLIHFYKNDDHLLIRSNSGEINSLLDIGYTQGDTLGYIWYDKVNSPEGNYYRPIDASSPYIRDLRRYNKQPEQLHLFANNPEETAPGWIYEGIKGFVWGSRW